MITNFKPTLSLSLSGALMLAALTLLSGQAQAADDKVLAVVDGHKITQDMFDRYQRRRALPKEMSPQQQQEVLLKELIDRQLIVQDAEKKKLDQSAELKAELADQRLNLLASAMLKKTATETKISDDKMKTAYDSFVKELGNLEYKASHILLSTEKEAKDVIAELNKGADFAQTAAHKSVGPSKENGGDLGWFSAQEMVKPFSDAVAKLKKGEITQAPVNTQFGWHVIKLEDTRKLPPPTFDSIKDQIHMRLQQQMIEEYLAGLHKTAKIEHKK